MKIENAHKEARSNFGPFKYMISFLLLLILLAVWSKADTALATTVTGSKVIVEVNYITETIKVSKGTGGSTKFYISTDKQKTWEDLNPDGVVDISAMLSAKPVEIFFKGNKDTEVNKFTLPEEPNNVTAVYGIKNGVGSITCSASGSAIEYRNGQNGTWKTPSAIMPTYLYEVKGATLQFRSAANIYTRAGKIINVKIPKRSAAPALKVDGGKLLITGIKANETQFFNADGFWQYVTTDSRTKTLTLFELTKLNPVSNSPMQAGAYEFRSYYGDKKVVSAVRLIEVPVQPTCPDTIKLEGNTLTITDATKRAYEYSILKSSEVFNPTTMKWSSVSANKSTKIAKAYTTDRIFVRLKSTTDKSKVVTPASTCIVLTVK